MEQKHGVVERRAHAKVNLALAVGPSLPAPGEFAGYHPITSWMACVELADTVRVSRLEEGEASRYSIEWALGAPRVSTIDWAVEKDLSAHAHRLLEGEAGRALPVQMRVRKRIPVGGGLGGGSADSAAALLAVRELFDLPVSMTRLGELATKLGSDVGFFLDEHSPARGAVVSNLGEQVDRVGSVAQPLVLVFPDFGCPTGAVYKAFDAENAGAGFAERAARVRELVAESMRAGRVPTDALFNDLEAAACRVEPRLREMVDRLTAELNAHVHVTGSGSTLFALAEDAGHAAALAARARKVFPGVAAIATRVV